MGRGRREYIHVGVCSSNSSMFVQVYVFVCVVYMCVCGILFVTFYVQMWHKYWFVICCFPGTCFIFKINGLLIRNLY